MCILSFPLYATCEQIRETQDGENPHLSGELFVSIAAYEFSPSLSFSDQRISLKRLLRTALSLSSRSLLCWSRRTARTLALPAKQRVPVNLQAAPLRARRQQQMQERLCHHQKAIHSGLFARAEASLHASPDTKAAAATATTAAAACATATPAQFNFILLLLRCCPMPWLLP